MSPCPTTMSTGGGGGPKSRGPADATNRRSVEAPPRISSSRSRISATEKPPPSWGAQTDTRSHSSGAGGGGHRAPWAERLVREGAADHGEDDEEEDEQECFPGRGRGSGARHVGRPRERHYDRCGYPTENRDNTPDLATAEAVRPARNHFAAQPLYAGRTPQL